MLCLFWLIVSRTCICADGGVSLYGSSFHTSTRRTSSKRLSVLFSFSLTHDDLTALPLLHGLLIQRLHLLVDLSRSRVKTDCNTILGCGHMLRHMKITDKIPLVCVSLSWWIRNVPKERARPLYEGMGLLHRNTLVCGFPFLRRSKIQKILTYVIISIFKTNFVKKKILAKTNVTNTWNIFPEVS